MTPLHASSSSRKRGRLWLLIAINSIAVMIIGLLTVVTIQGKSKNTATPDGLCKQASTIHRLHLQNDRFSAQEVSVKQCDRIIVTNHDELSYSLHFGQHNDHITYLGYTPSTLIQNERLEITMRQTGTFEFHDHFRDNARISLTVTSQR